MTRVTRIESEWAQCHCSARVLRAAIIALALSGAACVSPSAAKPDAPDVTVSGGARTGAVDDCDRTGEPPEAPEATAEPAGKDGAGSATADTMMEGSGRGTRRAVAGARSVLEEASCNSALWLDGLMVRGDGDLDAARRTSGYVELAQSHSQFYGSDTRIRARIRMELPSWEQRLSVYVGRENEQEFVRDRTEALALLSEFPTVGDDDQWLAGLGYSRPSSRRLQTDLRVGLASVQHPRAFAQARGLLNVYADTRNLLYARSTLFVNTREGLGLTAGIEYNRVLRPRLLFRLKESGTVSQKSEGVEWISAAILYQKLEHERGISWQAFVRGRTDADEPLREYGLRSVLQFPVFTRRLIGEVLTGYSWPRTDPELQREGSYQLGAGVKLLFGRDDER